MPKKPVKPPSTLIDWFRERHAENPAHKQIGRNERLPATRPAGDGRLRPQHRSTVVMRSRSSIIQRIILTFAVPVVAWASLLLACAKPHEMHSASAVPAAEGTVKATEDNNGNTNVSIQVKHLAPPSKVASDATVYVVWIKPRNSDVQNVGALTLSHDLEGSLETVTPHRRFQVMVTPEPSGQVVRATHPPVFTADVEQVD